MKRRIISLFLLAVMLCTLALSVSATTIQPRLNNTASTSTNFGINTSGKATITASFNGYYGTTDRAIITSYIEKQVLGLFWTRVDIGQPNNEWVDVSYNYADIFGHEIYLSETGTYRATVVYEISGSGGATDVINFDKTVTYP